MQQHFTIWPKGLSEKDLLDLTIRARSRGEKLAVWLEEQQDLIVLFDGKVGNSLDDYNPNGYQIVPGAHLIIDRTLSSMSGASIAGVRVEYANSTLTYSYQKRWGGRYSEFAKQHNTQKENVSIASLWQLHTQMNFAWCQHSESLQTIEQFFLAFGEMVAQKLDDIEPVHIPLVIDPDRMASMH